MRAKLPELNLYSCDREVDRRQDHDYQLRGILPIAKKRTILPWRISTVHPSSTFPVFFSADMVDPCVTGHNLPLEIFSGRENILRTIFPPGVNFLEKYLPL